MTTEVQPPPTPPSVWRVAASGVVGLTIGLLLVAWSMGTGRPMDEGDASDGAQGLARSHEATAGDGSESDVGDPESESDVGDQESESESAVGEPESESESESDVGDPESESDVGDPESESAVGDPESASDVGDPESESESESDVGDPQSATPALPAATASGTPGSTDFQRGRVAFLRCGEPNVRCGRDRDYEEAVWGVLASITSCPALAGRSGTADVRIHRQSNGTELRFRDWGEEPIAAGTLQSCLQESGLADLPIAVEGNPLIVSFRFRLR